MYQGHTPGPASHYQGGSESPAQHYGGGSGPNNYRAQDESPGGTYAKPTDQQNEDKESKEKEDQLAEAISQEEEKTETQHQDEDELIFNSTEKMFQHAQQQEMRERNAEKQPKKGKSTIEEAIEKAIKVEKEVIHID